jgi:long-chain acyl-CoA synthetase
MNLTELLERAAGRFPGKAALIEESDSVTYSGLVEQVSTLAAQLKTLQLAPGCRVGLAFPNSISYVALTFALWRIRVVVVPIPIECTAEEVAEIAATMRLAAIFSERPIQTGGGVPMAWPSGGYFTLLNPLEPPDNHGLDVAFIRFTSGTTNKRKGVVLTHQTIYDRVQAANRSLSIGANDTVNWCLPMAHHFLVTIVLYLSEGATIVLTRPTPAGPFLAAVNRWRGTVLYAAPFHYALLARDRSAARLDSVRLAVSTTCSLPESVALDFHDRFGRPLVPALGVIELGLVCLNLNDPVGRWNSVGRPPGDYRVRIVNPDDDGCGEIAWSGPGFLDAYAAPWQSRERVLRDGWFHTGDLGWLDAKGFLFLAGRKTAVINLAGRKIFPEEIEAVLNRHPAVRESRVFGRPHAQLGEVVEADIVLNSPMASLDEVREFCRKQLAPYKVPSQWHIVRSLPRTAGTGKIRRPLAVA